MKNKELKNIENFIYQVKSQLGAEFQVSYGYDEEFDEYYIYHNSKLIDLIEKQDNKQSELLLKLFNEYFHSNELYNIYMDHRPDLFKDIIKESRIGSYSGSINKISINIEFDNIFEYDLRHRKFKEIA